MRVSRRTIILLFCEQNTSYASFRVHSSFAWYLMHDSSGIWEASSPRGQSYFDWNFEYDQERALRDLLGYFCTLSPWNTEYILQKTKQKQRKEVYLGQILVLQDLGKIPGRFIESGKFYLNNNSIQQNVSFNLMTIFGPSQPE